MYIRFCRPKSGQTKPFFRAFDKNWIHFGLKLALGLKP